jgi:NAD(P)-dependent dehydrogenase (short-subunit alcohol dehydrogenase family)
LVTTGAVESGRNGTSAWFDNHREGDPAYGGTSAIGMMIARGLVLAGARVFNSSRKADAVRTVATDLVKLGQVVGTPGDVSTPDGARVIADGVRYQADRLHVLVNNAGVTWGAPLEEFPASGWDRVMHTNVEGLFHLTVGCLPLLRAAATAADPARVVNVGSVDGLHVPRMDNDSYSASKAAVHQLSRYLAHRVAPDHITVNAIAPGPFESRVCALSSRIASLHERTVADVPLRRFGRMESVTGTVQFLSSRAGSLHPAWCLCLMEVSPARSA